MRRMLAVLIISFVISAPITSTSAGSDGGAFNVPCPYSHSLRDDPIVYPGDRGASHLHDFAGNETADASSTTSSLVGSATTCRLSADTAAYWIPALYSGGHKVEPIAFTAYYGSQNDFVDPSTVIKSPRGFRMIGGYSSTGTSEPNLDMGKVFWECDGDAPQFERPPTDCNRTIELDIRFPFCWDGERKDSEDHREHVVYPTARHVGCPDGHPIAIPRLRLRVEYPITDGSTITFSSGAWWTVHADFWNAWRQVAFRRLVNDCIAANVNCGREIDP